MFEPFIAALGQTVSIVSVSYPATEGIQTYDSLQNIAASALPTDGYMVLLGESFSGPIAITLAAKFPSRVIGVVLCCSFLRNPRPGLSWLRSLLAVPAPSPPLPVVYTIVFGRFATTKLKLLMKRVLAIVPPVVLRERLRAVLDVDVRAQAQALQMPVLYLKATNDRLVPATATVDTQRHCPNMKIQEFEAPHCLLQAVPEVAAVAVTSFVKTAAIE
jgi:pimeloyl-[acyl-carrier protein] methyl ester esterase